MQHLKKIFFVTLSFIGWILSPFTWWNDAFINLPVSYILASMAAKFMPHSFLSAFLISYWFTNVLGLILMYTGAQQLSTKELIKKKKAVLLAALIIYSIVSAVFIKAGVLKPF